MNQLQANKFHGLLNGNLTEELGEYLSEQGRMVEGMKQNVQQYIGDIQPLFEKLTARAVAGDPEAVKSLAFLRDAIAGEVRRCFAQVSFSEKVAITQVTMAVIRTAFKVAIAL